MTDVIAAEEQTQTRGFWSRAGAYVASGLRYWEPRRVIYNAVLALVVLGHVWSAWPASRDKLSVDLVLVCFVLAVIANILYCSAYVADMFLQFSGLEIATRIGRPILWTIGCTFAAIVAHFVLVGTFSP
ncbi:MAG TPA: hypothetical protein VJN96_09745 [Vicinamibacterales bacterium]|nr:hypothetical protein [Vicinamibacterales bacterium]